MEMFLEVFRTLSTAVSTEIFLEFSFYEIALLFFIYSFIGWCVEVVFVAVTSGNVENRGFLNGPICPIYGCGMLGVLMVLLPIQPYDFLLFLGGAGICTTVEFLGGWLLDKIFHMRWWDYSQKPFNIGGYVCLGFSIMWGLGVIFAVKIIHPPIISLVRKLPKTVGWVMIGVFFVIFTVDMVVTLKNLIGIRRNLGQLEKLAEDLQSIGDQLKDVLGNSAIVVAEKASEGMDKVEARERIESVTEATKERIGNMSDATKERLESVTETTKEKWGAVTESTKEKLGTVTETTKEKLGAMSESTRQRLTAQRDEMETRRDMLMENIQKYSKHVWSTLPKLNKSGKSINIKEYMNLLKRK